MNGLIFIEFGASVVKLDRVFLISVCMARSGLAEAEYGQDLSNLAELK